MSDGRPLSKWRLLAVLFGVLVVVDQWTKYLAVSRLTTVFARSGADSLWERLRGFYGFRHLEALATEPYYVFRPLWRMNYVENPGAAWGLFRAFSDGFRNTFFTIVSIAAVAFIVRYYRKLRPEQRFLQVALSLVLAGAVGNFIDRLARRYVIDFIEWYWWNRTDVRWPTFNVADSLIVIGVAMLVVHPGPRKDQVAAVERSGEERARSRA